jgi:hypothetical protein
VPTLDQHQSSEFTKLVYIGDSSTGKTGSLASLVDDGYTFYILDMDNGLDPLVQYTTKKENLRNVNFETIRDKYKSTKVGPMVDGGAKAFVSAMDKLTEWAKIEDANAITVLDSGSALGKSAFEWAKGMNPSARDPRQWYFAAQQAIENVIALLTGVEYRQNVIFISHVNYKEVQEGVHKGYTSSIGSALGPTIPKYFNTLVLAESSGAGANVRRKIKTMPTGIIDLKVPNPKVEKELPLETGMSTLFKQLKGIE